MNCTIIVAIYLAANTGLVRAECSRIRTVQHPRGRAKDKENRPNNAGEASAARESLDIATTTEVDA